jgi:nitrogenase subunit NifH
MEEYLRKSGIDVIGDVPCGTHFWVPVQKNYKIDTLKEIRI